MALRTSSSEVIEVLQGGQDYDLDRAPSLTPYMNAANVLVTRVATCAASRGFSLTSDEKQFMEAWLAAYFYTRSDPIYQSKTTGGQSASFVADATATTERYKAGALALDPSGCLNAILKGLRARTVWVGKTADEQLTWEERNGNR